MGCFGINGSISRLPIVEGDKCVLFIGFVNSKDIDTYSLSFGNGFYFTPIALPIYGTYNDYGTIENIVKDKNVEFIENFLGNDIDTIIKIIDSICCDTYYSNVKQSVEISDKLNSLLPYSYKDYKIGLSIDHKFIFDELYNLKLSTFYDFKESIKRMQSYPYTLKSAMENDTSIEDSLDLTLSLHRYLKDNENLTNVNPNFKEGYFRTTGNYNSEILLSLYKEDNVKTLLLDLADEYEYFLTMYTKMCYMDWKFTLHNFSGQNGRDNLNLLKPLYKKIIKFIEEKQCQDY